MRKTLHTLHDILEMIEEFANVRGKEENIKVLLKGFKTSYEDYAENQYSRVRIQHTQSI